MTILIFILVGLIGQITHWLKKWTRNEIECGLIEYIMMHKKHTVGAVVTMIVSVVGLLSAGNVEITTQTIALAFFAGYGSDSALNKAP